MHTAFARIKSSRSPIHEIEGTDANGLPAFYYLRADPVKEKLLENALKTGKCDLANYGEILHSGYGTASADDIKLMWEKYGYRV